MDIVRSANLGWRAGSGIIANKSEILRTAARQSFILKRQSPPTILNAADNQWFFLDGRADTMWAQALQVIENPSEFDGDRLAVAHTIAGDLTLRHAYEKVFETTSP
jgi:cytochrome c peroxidase